MKRNDYCAYWVGLLDGDGSIQVNHWRKKVLQYRIIIKLKNIQENEDMLKLLSKYVGGRVLSDINYVRWVEDDKKRIKDILKILEEFPPLTKRINCQIKFMKECLIHNNLDLYFLNRDFKYDKYVPSNSSSFASYYPSWLSGFIEAEGCFSIRKVKTKSFSIGQKEDKGVLESIKKYFKIENKIYLKKNNFFLLEVFKSSILHNILEHIEKYPLLGAKNNSFQIFKKEIYSKK